MAESDAALLEALVGLAAEAGGIIRELYEGGRTVSQDKTDGTPVTEADQAAEAVILAGLRDLTPDIPVIAEEEVAAGRVPEIPGPRFWLVDPLDGTKEFLGRTGEFTVNIALVENGGPLLGVVNCPVLDHVYTGHVGVGSTFRHAGQSRPIAARLPPPEGLTVVASRRHSSPEELAVYFEDIRIAAERRIGSSLKICLIAAGEADIYPRFGRTMEWDIAAGHAVLAAAGGSIKTVEGEPFRYGKPNFENPHFVAFGRRPAAGQ